MELGVKLMSAFVNINTTKFHQYITAILYIFHITKAIRNPAKRVAMK